MSQWWWKRSLCFTICKTPWSLILAFYSGRWGGTWIYVWLRFSEMEIKGKMNMLNAKPIIHDCQHDRRILNLFRYNKFIFCWHNLCLLYAEFRSYRSFSFFFFNRNFFHLMCQGQVWEIFTRRLVLNLKIYIFKKKNLKVSMALWENAFHPHITAWFPVFLIFMLQAGINHQVRYRTLILSSFYHPTASLHCMELLHIWWLFGITAG